MSYVTTVTLFHRDYDGLTSKPPVLSELNKLMREKEPLFNQEFREVDSESYGGSKYPEVSIIGGGFNYLGDLEELIVDFVLNRDWDEPEHTVLVIIYQDDAARVVRPKGY